MSSLEALADEERREVLALLGQHQGPAPLSGPGSILGAPRRAASPFTGANTRSPIRSMLDVGGGPPSRRSSNASLTNSRKIEPVRSMLDIGIPLPTRPATRSMLDIGTTPSRPSTRSAQSSPITPIPTTKDTHTSNKKHPRSFSDAAAKPVEKFVSGSRLKTQEYKFSGYLPSNPGGPVAPKRVTQAGKALPSAMAQVVKSTDLGGYGRQPRNGTAATLGTRPLRSKSPKNGIMSPVPLDQLVLDNGEEIDINNAYRRLSDANLIHSKGGLGVLTTKTRRQRASSDISLNGLRLVKDYVPVEGEDVLADSSDADRTSDDEHPRGRRKAKGTVDRALRRSSSDQEITPLSLGRAPGLRTAQSLMAAAEEERECSPSEHVANLLMLTLASGLSLQGIHDHTVQTALVDLDKRHKNMSLFEPAITITGPSSIKSGRAGVHPNTAFDSGLNTPHDSEEEADFIDIKRAANLAITRTPINSTPNSGRCVRTLIRGDFKQTQQEAAENNRRVRTYLVATDLSEEAAHALEWTIGTVLRDGDTLLAIYCVDEKIGISQETGLNEAQVKEQAAGLVAAAKAAMNTPLLTASPAPSPMASSTHFKLDSTQNSSSSPTGRERSKAEQERFRAVEDIGDRVSKLLRKTKLQVKVVIEVIHCKSPMHLITEVIDHIEPTLVILGSRGRSALKGYVLIEHSNAVFRYS